MSFQLHNKPEWAAPPLDMLSLDIIPYQVQSCEENNDQTANFLSRLYDE